jgi:hypothetical protein
MIKHLKAFSSKFRFASTPLTKDIIVTILFCIFWLWFSYQYGFYNSPDSWYRGVLGKSIVEGHPFFINLKQGWLYEYGAWHHDAAHEPFLPILYALFFLVFGNKIIIANIISTLSAGLLIFPLLRLSRKLLKNPWSAFFIYALVVFNKELAYLFEVTSGLSIPTLLLALGFFLFFLWQMLDSDKKGWIWGAVLAMVSYYYVRSAAQLIFFWTMFWTLILSYKMLARENFVKVRKMWLIGLVFVVPWALRKLILFGSPFFSHMTPMFWTDRGYDYFSYHEFKPLPTPSSYFKTHSLYDFFEKIFVKGIGDFYSTFDKVTVGPLWLYLILFMISAGIILFQLSDKRKQFIFLTLWTFLIGYFSIYCLVPILDVRYFIPVYFVVAFTIISAIFMLYVKYVKGKRAVFQSAIFYLFLMGFVLILTRDFWQDNYFKFSYRTPDKELRQDPLVNALIKRIDKQDVILGPFANVQRLAFATGLTFIEEPDNLNRLVDPVAFFRKYNIRYSLIDVRRILPADMIENMEMVGDRVLYTIAKEGKIKKKMKKLFRDLSFLEEAQIEKAIQAGIKNRLVYIDSFHGEDPADFSVFAEIGVKVHISYGDLVNNKDKLFQCGLLLMRYAMQKKEMSDAEYAIIRQYIANGGRVLLLCPAWVWVAYEKKGVEHLPYYRIAENFDLHMTAEYVNPPLRIVNPRFKVEGLGKEISGTFSNIIYKEADPILVGSDGKTAAVAAKKGNARIIVWAQNNLLSREFSLKPEGRQFIKRIFDWLLE